MILLNDLKYIIEREVNRFPKMKPQDVVRLVYHHMFGNGKKVLDEDISLDFLKKEYETIMYANKGADLSGIPMYEDIGNYYARINLLGIDNKDILETVNDMYVATSKFSQFMDSNNAELFISRLYFIRELCCEGLFSFDIDELDEYLETYERQGYPLPNFSQQFKEYYENAYRIVDIRYIRLMPVIDKLRELLKLKDKVVVAFEGKAFAGKSTAIELLSVIFDIGVVHMEAFGLPTHLRTKERLKEAGGNVHYERFNAEVSSCIKKDTEFTYRDFDFEIDNYGKDIKVLPHKVMIVDGTYSAHPELKAIYDLKVFFDIENELQQELVYNTGSDQLLYYFNQTWLPYERAYLESNEIKDSCDIVISY